MKRSPIYLFAFELKFLRWNEKSREDDSRALTSHFSETVCTYVLLLLLLLMMLCVFFLISLFRLKSRTVSARIHNLTSSTLDRWIFGVKFSFALSPALSLTRCGCLYRIEHIYIYTKNPKDRSETTTTRTFSCIFVQFL